MYGNTKEVASLTPYLAANTGDEIDFSTITNPTVERVNRWLRSLSSQLDICLANQGFETPISADLETVHSSASMLVVEAVSYLVEVANGFKGADSLFGKKENITISSALRDARVNMCKWAEDNAEGLEKLGLVRSRTVMSELFTKDSDYDNIFVRDKYGKDN